jgi:hypothetical protein
MVFLMVNIQIEDPYWFFFSAWNPQLHGQAPGSKTFQMLEVGRGVVEKMEQGQQTQQSECMSE